MIHIPKSESVLIEQYSLKIRLFKNKKIKANFIGISFKNNILSFQVLVKILAGKSKGL